MLTGIDEEYISTPLPSAPLRELRELGVIRSTGLTKYQYRCRYSGAVEEIGGKADDRFQEILLDDPLADSSFGCTAEEHSMGDDDAHFSGVFFGGFDHVSHKSPVTTAGKIGRASCRERVWMSGGGV